MKIDLQYSKLYQNLNNIKGCVWTPFFNAHFFGKICSGKEVGSMKEFILITGASGGIGSQIAKTLATSGYSLYLHYNRNKESINQLLGELQKMNPEGEFIPIQADLNTKSGITLLCQQIYHLNGIVHNCGISNTNLLTSMQTEEIESLIQIHLTAPILITKQLLPKLIQNRNGSIIFISSIWGQTGAACETVYSAVKGGQIAFAKALSKEVSSSKVRVNVVSPGAIQTPMLSEYNEDEISELISEIPLGRLGTSTDVANAVEYLLSEKASYITGHVLNVNGGWYI